MLRPAPAALVALLLLACAAPKSQPASDPQGAGGAHYLRGIENDHVRPLRSISDSERLAADSSMREAMISGDQRLYVAAAAFRQGNHFALDMIVVNHREEAVQLQRRDIKLYDASGRELTALRDFPGAQNLGLRSKGQIAPPNFLYESSDEYASLQPDGPLQPSASSKTARNWTQPSNTRSDALSSWRAMQPEHRDEAAPPTLRVAADSGQAWWAYWEAAGPIAFPLTAFVVFGEEQLTFQFEEVGGRPAR